jgi:uncharacterized protein (DUF2267 family)
MARISLDDLLREVARRAGFPDASLPLVRTVTEATLSALASVLPLIDLRALQASLPDELAASLRVKSTRDSFFDHVARNERQDIDIARAHAESVLAVLGDCLDDDLRMRLQQHLPAHVAVHIAQNPRATARHNCT